jgi:hypothetical protein
MATALTFDPARAAVHNALEQNEQRIAESDARIAQLTERVTRIKRAKVDGIVDTRRLKAVALASGDNHPAQVVLQTETGQGTLRMTVGEVAHRQIGQRLEIHAKYYDRMQQHAPELLADNINWWLAHEPEQRMLRMLRADGLDDVQSANVVATGSQVFLRGVMGKGYRTIDDADLLASVTPALVNQRAALVDFSIDERRMHAKFLTQFFTMDELRALYAKSSGLTVEQVRSHFRVGGKDISWVDEPMGYGVTIRHSEVGFASLSVSFVERIAKCLNDYVAENALAIVHRGGKNGGEQDGDVRMLSDATQLIENAALLSRVTDTIGQGFDPKALLGRAQKIAQAKVAPVDRPDDIPLMEFVGNIGAGLGFTDTQTDTLREETVKAITEEGGETHFAYVQGITAAARRMTDYDARLDAERSGFLFLNDDADALVMKLGQQGAAKQRKAREN